MAAVETSYLDIPARPQSAPEEHRLCYRQWGKDNDGPVVLCVHGLTRNGRDFDSLAAALADKGYRVICPDMPGRGGSEWFPDPAFYNPAVYTADLIHLLDHLGITQVDWIGTSMGGILAMTFANAQPGRIRSVVLNDIGHRIPAEGLARLSETLHMPKPSDRAGLEQWLKTTGWATFDVPPDGWNLLFEHHLRQQPDGTWGMNYDPALLTAFAAAAPAQDMYLTPLCAALAATPALLIRGGKSDLLTPEIAEETRRLWQPGLMEVYEVPEAGHAPMLMNARDIDKVCGWLWRHRQQHGDDGWMASIATRLRAALVKNKL